MKTILFASHNPGKCKEIAKVLDNNALSIKPISDYGVPDVEETGLTFIENALLKARNACQHTQLPAFGDDSGLLVDSLHGAPGLYTARYAGPGCNNADNIDKLLTELAKMPGCSRKASFYCCMAFLQHATDPRPVIVEGIWEGEILTEPSGTDGFGYDPIFYVPTHHCSAAELPLTVKNQLSHRGKALAQLKTVFNSL